MEQTLKEKNRLTRAYGIALVCSYLLHIAGKLFKEDNAWYKSYNKNLLDKLLTANKHIYERAEKLRENQLPVKSSLSVDTEVVTYERDFQLDTLFSFVNLFFTQPYVKLIDLSILLSNVEQGKRLYTKEEVEVIVKASVKDMSHVEVTSEFLARHIPE